MSLSVVPIALGISVMWGLQPVVHKYVLSVKKIDPKAILFVGGVGYTTALALFSTYYFEDVRHEVTRMDWTTIVIIAALSVITAFVANLLYLNVLKDHATFVVTALMYSAPVFTLILAVLLLREKVTPLSGLGGVLMLLGVGCFAMNERLVGPSRT